MSERKTQKSNKNDLMKDVGNIASVVAIVTNYIGPVIDEVRVLADKVNEERKGLVTVPELYLKGYPLTSVQAMEQLENCGLKGTIVKTTLHEADAKYRDCIDNQVIHTYPQARRKVDPGTIVNVKIITQEVIDESKRLYDEAEQQRIIFEEERAKRKEQAVPLLEKIGSKFKHDKAVEKEESNEQTSSQETRERGTDSGSDTDDLHGRSLADLDTDSLPEE